VYLCQSCDRWFCEKHLKPRLFHIMGLDGVPPESKLEFYREWKREDSHPDFQYSQKRLEELHLEEKIRFELIDKALNGENFSRCPKCRAWYNLCEEIAYCPKCGYQLSTKIPHAEASSKSLTREIAEYEEAEKQRAKATEEKRKEAVISEGQFHFEKKEAEYGNTEKSRRHFPVRKVIGAMLAIIIIGALVWYAQPIVSFIASHVTFPSQNSGQPIWNTETFQLVQASFLAPVVITRHFELQSGNHLVGNFQFSALPTSNYEIGVGILDPLQGALQAFINKTSGSFDITASISGAYEMNFGFACTQQVTAPYVTLNTRIVR